MGFGTNRGLQPADTILDSMKVIATDANYGLRYANTKSINQFLDPNSEQTEFTFYFDTIFRMEYDSLPEWADIDSSWSDTILTMFRYDSVLMQYEFLRTQVDTTLLSFDTIEVFEWNVFLDSIYTREVIDKVTVGYKPVPHLVSHDCGFTMYFENITIESYTTNYIDTVIVVWPNITNEAQKNIEILF